MKQESALVDPDAARALSVLFTRLDQDDQVRLAQIVQTMRVERMAQGDLLFRPGVSCERFAMLMDGTVAVSLIHQSRSKLLYRVSPGQLCVHTLTNLLNSRDYAAEAVAQTEVCIACMDAGRFQALYAAEPALQRLVAGSLAERCLSFVGEIYSLCFRSIHERLAETMLLHMGRDGWVYKTHLQLAGEIGSTREVVSRQLKQWALVGWVQSERNRVFIKEIDALHRLAG